jgi:hypothetical protein
LQNAIRSVCILERFLVSIILICLPPEAIPEARIQVLVIHLGDDPENTEKSGEVRKGSKSSQYRVLLSNKFLL